MVLQYTLSTENGVFATVPCSQTRSSIQSLIGTMITRTRSLIPGFLIGRFSLFCAATLNREEENIERERPASLHLSGTQHSCRSRAVRS